MKAPDSGRSLRSAGPLRLRRTTLLAALAFLVIACSEESSTALEESAPDVTEPLAPAGPQNGAVVHVIEPSKLEIVSRVDEMGGVYHLRSLDGVPPQIARDEIIVGEDDGMFARRVVSAEYDGQNVMLETARAYLHEFAGQGLAALSTAGSAVGGPALGPSVPVGGTVVLPTVSVPLNDLDVCLLTDSLISLIPGNLETRLCGQERNFSVGVAAVGLTVRGALTDLYIHEGLIEVSGEMDVATTLDVGGVTGGSPPVFTPCNRASFPGCLTTPTGAALIDFLRQYAPSIPDGSLSPVRVCIPGTPVRVRAGRWDYSGFLPRWIPPVFEQCRMANVGTLPTVELPSVEEVYFQPRPDIRGSMVMDVKGTGGLQLNITIPGVTGATAGARLSDKVALKGSVGFFLRIDVELSKAGARVAIDFDEGVVVTQQWTEAGGWTGDVDVPDIDIGGSVDPIGPDSVRLRAGLVLEVKGEACAALVGACKLDGVAPPADTTSSFSLALGAQANASMFRMVEGQWARTPSGNWSIDADGLYEVKLGGGLSLPLSDYWLPPSVPIEWAPDPWEIARTDLTDTYGTGRLQVRTTTTGSAPDSDGYQVRVERVDTLPVLIEDGAERVGEARDHGARIVFDAVANGSQFANALKSIPCVVGYSDAALFFGVDIFVLSLIHVARRNSIAPPNFAFAARCQLLIAGHVVTLTGVADNCTVQGGNSQTVVLQQKNVIEARSDTTTVDFQIDCVDPGTALGELTVTTATTGSDPDADGYTVVVDSNPLGYVEADGSRDYDGLAAGTRSVSLEDVAPNCSVVGANPRSLDVPIAGSIETTFAVDCSVLPTPQRAVRLNATTSGPQPDTTGYVVRLDGDAEVVVRPQSSVNFPGIALDSTSVLNVSDIAANCRLEGLSPTIAVLDPVSETGEMDLQVSCTSDLVDTTIGVVSIVRLPTPVPFLRTTDGSSYRLTGVLARELAALGGQEVTIRGVVSTGTLDVYGYALTDEGTRRHRGIVVPRDGGYELVGAERFVLVDPPGRLQDHVGRLVWVAGNASGNQLAPEAFGLIREGR